MPKIQERKGRLSVTVPIDIAKRKRWKGGDDLIFGVMHVEGKEIVYVDKIKAGQ